MPATSQSAAPRRIDRERFLELAKQRGANRIEDAADLVGYTRQQLHKLFKGQHQPTSQRLCDMAEALGCQVEDIYRTAA